jgi:hypothetical protein
MTQSLWGALETVPIPLTPHKILLEQASFVKEMTGGLLHGRVGRSRYVDPTNIFGTTKSDLLLSTLSVVAPSLANYTYQVLTVRYPMTLYPAIVTSAQLVETRCESEGALKSALKSVLSAPQVLRVMQGLIAQIQSDTPAREK